MGGRGAKSGLNTRGKRGQYQSYQGKDVAFSMFKEETGFSGEKANIAFDALSDYFGGAYGSFGDKDLAVIDNALSHMGVYDGTIYRGVGVESSKLNSINVGDTVQVAPKDPFVASWSSDLFTAEYFAMRTSYNEVIFTCKNNKSAVGVQHLSIFGKEEAEVLAPSTAKYRILSKSVEKIKYSNREVTHIEVEEI